MAASDNGYSPNPAPVASEVVKRIKEKGDQRTYPTTGQIVAIHYVGYIARTQVKFDSSVEKGVPFVFQLGAGKVIRGFDAGVMGMCLGERSELFIPAEMGYGARGSGDVIPPNADLVFDLKVLSIQDPPTESEATKFKNSSRGGSLNLLAYLCKLVRENGDLDLAVFEKLLPEADVCASVTSNKMDRTSLLHIVSQLAEDYETQLMQTVIKKLVDAGADLGAVDGFGETPLTTVLCMMEEDEREEDENDPGPPDIKLLEALACYLDLDQQDLNEADAARALHQLGRISDQSASLKDVGLRILDLISKRIPKTRVEEIRQGGKLIDYLCTFYDTLEGADPKIVRSLLDARADPAVVQSHSGSNAFHFIALNAYGTYDDVFQIFKMLLDRNHQAAKEIDKTGFTVFSLAADYKDTARQFDCKPNACAMLALGDLLPLYDVDAGMVCLKVDEESKENVTPSVPQLRFGLGDRVKCWVQAPGENAWEEGAVVSLGYREKSWLEGQVAAYEVKLDIGGHVFVLSDNVKLIRPEHEKTKAAVGKRFVKQPTENGWELLDTVTGKTRPSSPPDSDED